MTARDPKEVATEIEKVGQDGMNAPFTLPASEGGTQGGGEGGGGGSGR